MGNDSLPQLPVDLNYSNPTVLIEMLDIILFWANQGVDVLRLDAVAFLWKKSAQPPRMSAMHT